MPRGVVHRRHHQTAAFSRAPVHNLDNVDQLLLVGYCKVDLVVVARAQVDHHVLIPPKEHDRTRVVEFVHWQKLVFEHGKDKRRRMGLGS